MSLRKMVEEARKAEHPSSCSSRGSPMNDPLCPIWEAGGGGEEGVGEVEGVRGEEGVEEVEGVRGDEGVEEVEETTAHVIMSNPT